MLHHVDRQALAADLDALRAELKASTGPADLAHFRRIERAGRALTLLGLATAWLWPNPLTVLALALGTFARWAIVAHHVCHRGYDKVPGAPARLRSRRFARGPLRRALDWLDWMVPDAWHHEHDYLHHYRLGEAGGDPDVAEENAWWLRDSRLPMAARAAVVLLGSTLWKPLYYAPNTLNELLNHQGRRGRPGDAEPIGLYDRRLWSPLRARFWRVAARCWLPYAAWRFGALPALFLWLGPDAWLNALLNLLLAELLTNFWSFWVIVPNHTGDDLYRFDGPVRDRGDFYLRQIVGSVDYRCGGDLNDFLHGWLNYQVEHHLFPDLTLRQYQRAHGPLRALCAKHGVPLVQESVFRRARRTLDVLIGRTSMRRWREEEEAVAA